MTHSKVERPAATSDPRPTVLHAKFQGWLPWSQPFVHDLVMGMEADFRGVVLCNRTENLDRFPFPRLERVPFRVSVRPSHAALHAARLAKRWAPRALHAHFGWSALRTLLLRHFLGVPLVTTFGGRDITIHAKLEGIRPLYDVLLAHSDRIVCVSESLRRTAIARGADPERTFVIRRGTDLARFDFVDRSDRDRSAPLRVLSVGRLVPKKGHRDAVEAIARLVHAGFEATLRIVGEGEEESPVRACARELGIADRVAFVGPRPQAEVRAELAAADVLLHPARHAEDGDTEGLPNAVVEAAATGLPVVATRHAGLPEAVVDGETGWLLEEGDVPGIAAALAKLAREPAMRLMMGKNAASHARESFDGRRQVAAYGEIYRELLELHPPGDPRCRLPLETLETVPPQLWEARRHPTEVSISELMDAHCTPQRWAERGWPRLVERAYALRRHVPGSVKFPVKRWLGAALAGLGGPSEPLSDRERAFLRGLGGSIDLDGIDSSWTPEVLRREIEGRSRRSRRRRSPQAAG
jgi:colanic acid/amylovoran biosynthesis glycosyltransferase